MFEDPIVKEVRDTRQRIFARFNYDLAKYLQHLSEQEKLHAERVVTLEEWRRRHRRGEPPDPGGSQG